MKQITENRKLFGITKDANLGELKTIYRTLMKEWHPDKFQESDTAKLEAETKSKTIINAYHFLVSLSPETRLQNQVEYKNTTATGIDDFIYKGQMLKITFGDGSAYEYFGIPKTVYNKLINSSTQNRFARRHIFEGYSFRKANKATDKD